MSRSLIIERVHKAARFYLESDDDEVTMRTAADRYGVSYGAVHRAVKQLRSEHGTAKARP